MKDLSSPPEDFKQSPLMLQWQACKESAKEALLLFRLGDFYEAFYEDAAILSKEVDVTLTQRQGIPMSGVPAHASESYIDKLISKGFKVAIAEQVEDPKKAKGLVKREVVRILSPATVISSNLLHEKNNNYFASLSQVGDILGLAFLDLTTSEFWVCEFTSSRDLHNELYRLRPAEILTGEKFCSKQSRLLDELKQSFSFLLNTLPDWHFDPQITHDFLVQHFNVHHLEGFGLAGKVAAINASGSLLRYLKDSLSVPIHQVTELRSYSSSQFMALDQTTQRNLELTSSLKGEKKNTLLSVLDHTQTPMGGRLLQHWIKQPLLSVSKIKERQGAIQSLLSHREILDRIKKYLIFVRDIERLIMKVVTGYATPRDISALHSSFHPLSDLKILLSHLESPLIQEINGALDPLSEMNDRIATALVEEPPLRMGEGKIFRDGFNPELDELRAISHNSKTWIAQYQNDLREQIGIKTLKVGFNKMFGYYIEVSRGQSHKIPDTFLRRQTLVNAERYLSPVLKEYESKVLTAEERINAIENALFISLREEIASFSSRVLSVARAIAHIDCITSLADVALQNNYCCPIVDNEQIIHIEGGRHPIIEQVCKKECFVPNDTYLDDSEQRLHIITGPNMSGKSTFLRQVALITIMSQMGSFVPAKRAHMGIIDKVFTRIGANDDLSRGQSTFMVEMTETANILNNVTSRSLVILDEIGRGTSTYDGISIAWSVAEYLLTAEGKSAKTLFATHYFELTQIEGKIFGAVNYNVAVLEASDHISFLRKIVRGGTDKSYGIHVAKLAGMPREVILRSREILDHLEENENRKNLFEPKKSKIPASSRQKTAPTDVQLSFL